MAASFTPSQRLWLIENIPKGSHQQTAERFSELFFPLTAKQVHSFAGRNRVHAGSQKRIRTSIWNDENEAYFASIVPGRQESEIRELFRERYGVTLTESQIGNAKRRLGVKSGTHGGRFEKGIVPWTKGRRQADYCSAEALERIRANQFKKGESNGGRELPVGSEYVDAGGLVYVKVADIGKRFGRGGMWRPRSHIVWERETGEEIREGERIMHCNRVPGDDRIENLAKVDARITAVVNSMGVEYCDKETYMALVDIAKAKMALTAAKRELRANNPSRRRR